MSRSEKPLFANYPNQHKSEQIIIITARLICRAVVIYSNICLMPLLSFFRVLQSTVSRTQIVASYLKKINFDEKDRDRSLAHMLSCDGMLGDDDHCLERLACEFSDPVSYGAPHLDRSVSSMYALTFRSFLDFSDRYLPLTYTFPYVLIPVSANLNVYQSIIQRPRFGR